jgi:DNA-binding PadR family transcriptional regulator
MTSPDDIEKYLPLTESTYYILLTLAEPLHGYGVMQRVAEISGGVVKIGPGTLYGAFTTLEKEGLIVKVSEDERRKSYTLTQKGKMVLLRQIERLVTMSRNGLTVSVRLSLDIWGGETQGDNHEQGHHQEI